MKKVADVKISKAGKKTRHLELIQKDKGFYLVDKDIVAMKSDTIDGIRRGLASMSLRPMILINIDYVCPFPSIRKEN